MPPQVIAVEMWDDGEDATAGLTGSEREAVADSVEGRRREFAQGRMCAREALKRLGMAPAEVPVAPDGSPSWPCGVVGSITHKGAYRAAAVARSAGVGGLGIDAELSEPLPAGVLETIATPAERTALARLGRARPDVFWGRLLFSAKEAAFKATAGTERDGVSLRGFTIALLEQGDRLLARSPVSDVPPLEGRWALRHELLLVAFVVPRAARPGADP